MITQQDITMQIGTEFLEQTSIRFSKVFDRILSTISQLNDEQIWFRPSSRSNSVGIIIRHLTGNLNQWIGDAIGGYSYQRNRPSEFKDENHLSKDEILNSISDLSAKIQDIVSKLSSDELLSRRHIQGYDMTVLSAIYTAVTHLELHAGQISYITKYILNENYKEYWKPANTEQGK
jgi:uncharacterized damage-inducible protein DinB